MHPSYEPHHPSDTRHQSLPLPLPEVRNIEDSPLEWNCSLEGGKTGEDRPDKREWSTNSGLQILDGGA
jgi:hypothetical protein